jgi:MoxR-like ATPase
MMAVNAAIASQRPLLIKGERRHGKTLLAIEVARALMRPLFEWHIKSTHKAQHGLYEYDAVSGCATRSSATRRVADIAQLHREGHAVERVHERRTRGAADRRDRQGRHRVPERPAARARPHGFPRARDRADDPAKHRPIVLITSNNEKELPDAFLRRCFFHYIRFPTPRRCSAIVDVHFPGIKRELLHEAS